MASRYPFTIGRQGDVIYPMDPTGLTLNYTILPQELKKRGYDTHAVGKWHLGFCKWEYTPTQRGFDSFYGYYTGSENYYTHYRNYSYAGKHTEAVDRRESGYDFRSNTSVNWSAQGQYSAFLFADRVDGLLRSRSPGTPLFLYMPFQSVHAPLQVPRNYSDLYKNISDVNRRTYLGMVTAMDEAVGRIVTSLKETGHYDNSVIVFTTDNGGPTISGSNNWPLRGNKTTLWEGGTRGAAFIHSPILSYPGSVSNRLVHVTDWYPTFMHLAGMSDPQGIDGLNQWEALNNASLSDARDFFVYDLDETNGIRAAVRWGRYKLIVGDPGPSSWSPPTHIQEVTPAQEEAKTTNEELHANSIFSTTFRKAGKRTKRTDAAFMRMAVEYFTDRLMDMKDILKPSSRLTESRASNENRRDATHVSGDRVQKDKVLQEELKRRYRLSSGANLRLSDFKTVQDIVVANVTMQLYDVLDDPDERLDLAKVRTDVVHLLLARLQDELPRYHPREVYPDAILAAPDNYGGTWSPGWC
ncbi:hypothetical protein HAZT_HAZT002130 [Hyalella azteca]|nr:hypothetical protein HAZT_HAZT002130 [Hyalella azteca]